MDTKAHVLRFAIVPKVAHPWFEEVHHGAQLQAHFLQEQLDRPVAVDYLPPPRASATEQDSVLARVASTRPSGIAVDPVDAIENLPAVRTIQDQGIPLVVFDSPSSDPAICSVGNDFAEQGALAARRLVALIEGTGKVAVMEGFPTAPNHRQRYQAQLQVLSEHPAVTVVAGGADNDDIRTAAQQAAAVLAAHPDLKGYLCCDASGPIGIAAAIKEAGKVGSVKVVGIDGIEAILREIKDGVLESSVATIPGMQGSMALLMLWQASQGIRIPQRVDTGIDLITPDNVDDFLAAYRSRGTPLR